MQNQFLHIKPESGKDRRGRACAKDFIYRKFCRRHEREIRALFRCAGRAIEEVRKREKAHVGRDPIDNGLRIAFGGIGSYDRTGNPFPELSNPLNFACRFDCETYRIEPARRGAIRNRIHIYIICTNCNTRPITVPDTRDADISAKCGFHDLARAFRLSLDLRYRCRDKMFSPPYGIGDGKYATLRRDFLFLLTSVTWQISNPTKSRSGFAPRYKFICKNFCTARVVRISLGTCVRAVAPLLAIPVTSFISGPGRVSCARGGQIARARCSTYISGIRSPAFHSERS